MAGAIDPALIEIFRAEVNERTEALRVALAGDAWPPPTGSLVLLAHSLRGAARVLGLTNADKLAAALQSLVGKLEKAGATPTMTARATMAQVPAWFDALSGCGDEALVAWDVAQADQVAEMIAELKAASVEASTVAAPVPVTPAVPPKSVAAMRELMRDDSDAFADASILALFRSETEVHTRSLSDGLLALERDPDRRNRLDALMRAAHSIKGAARIVSLSAAVGLAHELEDYLQEARDGKRTVTAATIDELLAAVDLFAQLAQVPAVEATAWVRDQTPQFVDMTARLVRLRSGLIPAEPQLPLAPAEPATAPPPSAPRGRPPSIAPPPPVAPSRQEPQVVAAQAARADEVDERVVRVSTADVNRMLALAGEVRIQTQKLHPMTDELSRLQSRQTRLVDLIDQLRRAVGDDADVQLVDLFQEARRTARACRQAVVDHLGGLHNHVRRSEDIGERLYRQSIASRMRPFGDGVRALPRLVRDLSRRLGKAVDLEIIGGAVGVDRDILDRLDAPLGHMIRNAVDHGIEKPEEREANGKPERGTIWIEARHAAGRLTIRVNDDGRGIDPEKVRAKIVRSGLADAEAVAKLTDAAVLDYLFRPGFSTTDEITDVSGRGVGLDVVQDMIRAVEGTLRLTSEPGRGTTLHLQVPLTLSVMRAVLVTIADDAYAVPLRRVHRVLSVPASEVQTLENHQYFTLDGEHVALASARDLLELVGEGALPDPLCVLVIGEHGAACGLAVDRFLGEQDVVVRPLDPRLGKVPDVSAATLTADGDPMLILDVDDLLQAVARLAEGGTRSMVRIGDREARRQTRKRVLVVDDSLTVREAERQLLVNRGYDVTIAVDGLEGREMVQREPFDLVITDVDMPRMDGIELVRFIKQDARLAAMPVMIVSYRDKEEDRIRGRDAGAQYYLTKSNFHDATLIDAVIDLIGEPEIAT